MTEHKSVPDAQLVSRDRVCTIIAAVLRAAQMNYTDAQLEALSGIPARTIKSYRIEGKEPCLSNALSLASILGKEAVNAVLSLIQYGGAKPLDDHDAHTPMQMVANIMQPFNVIVQAAADNRFDHNEMPECRKAADMIIAEVLPISSAGADR